MPTVFVISCDTEDETELQRRTQYDEVFFQSRELIELTAKSFSRKL